MKRKDYQQFVQCDCGSEYLVITPQDPEFLDCGLYLAILNNQFTKYSFWHRFRHMWHTLIHGTPYVDQMCLDLDKVKEIEKYISNFIALAELDKKRHTKKTKE